MEITGIFNICIDYTINIFFILKGFLTPEKTTYSYKRKNFRNYLF